MTDAISSAQRVTGCENGNSQNFVHTKWKGKTPPQITALYPEYEGYVNCLINNLVRITNNSQTLAQRSGGLNNPQIMQICLPIFEQNRKQYCINQVKNNPNPTNPDADLTNPSLDADPELLKAEAKARAQKILTDKEEEAIKKANIFVETLKRNAAELLTKDISIPIIRELVQTQLQEIIDDVEEKIKKMRRENALKSKTALLDNKNLFTYPMTPIVVDPVTGTTDTSPQPPKIEPLPTI